MFKISIVLFYLFIFWVYDFWVCGETKDSLVDINENIFYTWRHDLYLNNDLFELLSIGIYILSLWKAVIIDDIAHQIHQYSSLNFIYYGILQISHTLVKRYPMFFNLVYTDIRQQSEINSIRIHFLIIFIPMFPIAMILFFT